MTPLDTPGGNPARFANPLADPLGDEERWAAWELTSDWSWDGAFVFASIGWPEGLR